MLMISLPLIMAGCRTVEVERKITLPPEPQRQELKNPENIKDMAEIISYYEHLVQEWENWADIVIELTECN